MQADVLIPYGHSIDDLPMKILQHITIFERGLVVTEYGFMMGVFDYATGGKICDVNVGHHIGLTQQQYIEGLIEKATDTIKFNSNWLDVLNQLPTIN
jgi:hypothetical protein